MLRSLDRPEIAAVQVWCSFGFWRSSSRHFGVSEPDRSDRCRAFSGNPVVFLWWCATCSQSASGARLALESFVCSRFCGEYFGQDLG